MSRSILRFVLNFDEFFMTLATASDLRLGHLDVEARHAALGELLSRGFQEHNT